MRRRYGFCFSLKPAFRLWAASWRSLDDSQRHTRAISFQLTHVTSGMVTVWGPAQIRKTKPVWRRREGESFKITLIPAPMCLRLRGLISDVKSGKPTQSPHMSIMGKLALNKIQTLYIYAWLYVWIACSPFCVIVSVVFFFSWLIQHLNCFVSVSGWTHLASGLIRCTRIGSCATLQTKFCFILFVVCNHMVNRSACLLYLCMTARRGAAQWQSTSTGF